MSSWWPCGNLSDSQVLTPEGFDLFALTCFPALALHSWSLIPSGSTKHNHAPTRKPLSAFPRQPRNLCLWSAALWQNAPLNLQVSRSPVILCNSRRNEPTTKRTHAQCPEYISPSATRKGLTPLAGSRRLVSTLCLLLPWSSPQTSSLSGLRAHTPTTRGAFIPIMPSPSILSFSPRLGTSTKSQFRPLVYKCGWWSGRIQRSRVYYLSSKSRSIAVKRHDATRLVESSSESHCLICSH